MVRKFNVLVIEGNQEKMYNIVKVVSNSEINAIKVETGQDALYRIYNHNIDMVLFDADIEDMDSIEVIETILTYERTYDIPLILITEENRSDEFILKSYELGISDYIKKPINYKILRYKIEKLVNIIRDKRGFERKNLMLKRRIDELEETIEELSEDKNNAELDSNIDALTNIPNRRMFDKVLEEEWYRLMRTRDPLAVMMIDIDFFKQYNDVYGHIRGDECLKKVARIIDQSFNRVGDFVARYGGEEFVVLVPNFEYDDAKIMANILRENIFDANIEHKGSSISEYLTVSIGISTIIPSTKYSKTDLVDEADSALYLAKKSGRNIAKGIEI